MVLASSALAQTAFDYIFNKVSDDVKVEIVEVLATDTFLLDSEETVKLIGLRGLLAPKESKKVERDKHGFVIEPEVDPEDPIEKQANDFVRSLVKGKKVRIEYDSNKKDEQFNTVVYLFLEDDTLLNAEILRQGYAHLKIRPPNTKYADQLREAYKEARRELRGLQSN